MWKGAFPIGSIIGGSTRWSYTIAGQRCDQWYSTRDGALLALSDQQRHDGAYRMWYIEYPDRIVVCNNKHRDKNIVFDNTETMRPLALHHLWCPVCTNGQQWYAKSSSNGRVIYAHREVARLAGKPWGNVRHIKGASTLDCRLVKLTDGGKHVMRKERRRTVSIYDMPPTLAAQPAFAADPADALALEDANVSVAYHVRDHERAYRVRWHDPDDTPHDEIYSEQALGDAGARFCAQKAIHDIVKATKRAPRRSSLHPPPAKRSSTDDNTPPSKRSAHL
jgi:hypothetical protein